MDGVMLTLIGFFIFGVVAHIYTVRSFKFVHMGLSFLEDAYVKLDKEENKLADHDKVMSFLKNVQIKGLTSFLALRDPAILATYACICINTFMISYPFLEFLHATVVGYILIIIMIIVNSNAAMLIKELYKTRRLVDVACTKYDNLLIAYADMAVSQFAAVKFFDKFTESIESVLKEIENKNNKDEDNKNDINE